MAKLMNPSMYVIGNNAAMWLDKATAEEAKVLGLQGMGLALGFTQTAQTVPMMGQRIAPKVYSGAEFDEMSANANYIPGDPTQQKIRFDALTGTLVKNIRLYMKDGCHFTAPDQIASKSGAGNGLMTGYSGLNVGSFGDPSIGSPSDIFGNTISFAPGGMFAEFIAHTEPGKGDELTIAGGGAGVDVTITTTGTEWAALGFEVGDTVIVDWDGTTPEVPKYGKVSAVNTDVLTLLADEGDTAAMKTGTLPAKGAVHGASSTDLAEMDLTC